MSGSAQPLIALEGIGKAYGAVTALAGIDLDLHAGEVLAICGDNGAGKSSLIKIMSGAEEPTSGVLRLRGQAQRFRSPHDALSKGVATIYQDLALAPRLSISENVFMGAELTCGVGPFRFLDKRRMAAEARGYLARLAVTIEDMDRPVEKLSGGQRQAVAISRALRWNAEIIIMDEPTAALGVKETGQVLDLISRLAAEGRTVVLISHSMRDVAALATRVVILKGGRKIIDMANRGLTGDAIGHMIMEAAAA